jgi:hypothetical protein
MKIESFEMSKHYRTVAAWWSSHSWEPLPISMLSKTGYVAYKDDTPVAASWLYKTDSSIAILDWYISDPEAAWEDRQEAIQAMIDAGSKDAKEMGFHVVLSFSQNKRLGEKLENSGFKETDNNMTHYIKGL